MNNNSLKIVEVPIADLKGNPKNPRVWSDAATKNLKASIRAHGLVDPVLLSGVPERMNQIISGHFRVSIMRELGYKTMPAIYLNIASEDKERALALRLNRVGGDWDIELLREFDPTLLLETGFDETDLSRVWDDLLEISDDHFDTQKALADIKIPRTKTGDLITLGKHKVICGSAEDESVVAHLMSKERADLIYADFPFNINLNYESGIGGTRDYGGTLTNDNKSPTEYRQFLKNILTNCLEFSKLDIHVFGWCDQSNIWLLQILYPELGLAPKRVLTWLKNQFSPTPKIAFSKSTENIVYGVRGKPFINQQVRNLNEIVNKEVGSGNRTLEDIIDLIDLMLVKRLPSAQYEHPCEKSPELCEKPLRRCSKPGDIILDPCGGSGMSTIAAEQLGRRCFTVEIQPIFVDLICRRFTELTGIEPVYEKVTRK